MMPFLLFPTATCSARLCWGSNGPNTPQTSWKIFELNGGLKETSFINGFFKLNKCVGFTLSLPTDLLV